MRQIGIKIRLIMAIFMPIILCIGCEMARPIPAKTQGSNIQSGAMSINACSDQLLFALADKEQIISLSHYARDKQSSPIVNAARQLPINHESAEEILSSKPAILLQSPFEKPAINEVTKALKIKTYSFGVPSNIEEALKMVETAGYALGQENRANELANKIKDATKPERNRPIRTLIYFQGGYSAGENTLIDDIMTRLGFHNMARDFGVGNWGRIDTESIITKPPELLIIANTNEIGTPSQKIMRHEALFRSELGIKFANMPNQYSYCGGPIIIELANHLKRIRKEYEAQ